MCKWYKFDESTDTVDATLPKDIEKRSYFNMTGMEKFRLVNATLWVYLEPPTNNPLIPQRFVFPLFIHKFINGSEISEDPVIKKDLRVGLHPNGSWADINITSIVNQWVEKPETNFGLMVKAMYHGQDLVNRDDHPIDRSRVGHSIQSIFYWTITIITKRIAEINRFYDKQNSHELFNESNDFTSSPNISRYPYWLLFHRNILLAFSFPFPSAKITFW